MLDELKAILAADFPSHDATLLYDRCYTQSILAPVKSTPGGDLTPSLEAANQSRSGWDEGWRADQVLEDGRVLARKGGSARAFPPGEYLINRGLLVFRPSGSPDLQPGFYYAFGETASDFTEGESGLRFYWNVTAEGAPRLVEEVTREFNRFQVPFRMKCANDGSHYPRRDAAVIYLNRRYYPIAALLLEPIHCRIAKWLEPGTPLFAKRLADGLALAEDPGESFGRHRCGILSEAMTVSHGQPLEERLSEVRRQFERRGLSLARPWLNAESRYCYEFPFPVSCSK